MVSRENSKSAARRAISGTAIQFALKASWQHIFPKKPTYGHEEHSSLRHDFGQQNCPAELRSAIDTLKTVRRRIMTNTFLQGLTQWWTWLLAALIIIGAISARLAGAMVFGGVLAVAGAVLILVWILRNRLSIYDTARRLDSAAGLQDRISTAIFLANEKDPDEMVQYQRQDAIARLGKVEPRGLFPVGIPATASRALVLLLAAAGLFAYRLHHKAPLTALLQSTARSQLVQSILAPLARTLENDLQRTVALASAKPDAPPDEVRPPDPDQAADDMWQNGDDKGSAVQEEQEAMAQPPDQAQAPGDQDSQGDENGQPGNPSDTPSPDANGNQTSGKQGDQQGEAKNQSMSQALMQALKNLMPSPPGQESNNRPNEQKQPNSGGMPQSGNSHQPGTTPDDRKSDSRGSSDARQKSSENSSSGAGNQDGNKELRPGLESRPVKAVPDRVALAPSGFKDPTRIRNNTDTGVAGVAIGNATPQAVSVINGAEQENIPARYRLYVQHYFEHADAGSGIK